MTPLDQSRPLDDAIQRPCSPHMSSRNNRPIYVGFYDILCILQGFNGFLAISEENSEVEGDDPPTSDSPEKSFAGFKIHVLSMIHEALMPFDPCTTLRTKKHS